MKTKHTCYSRLSVIAFLSGSYLLLASVGQLHGQAPTPAKAAVDPASHAAHVAAGLMPPDAPAAKDAAKSDPALSQQITSLQAKVAQLETALAKTAPAPVPPAATAPAAAPMPGMAPPAAPAAAADSAAPPPAANAPAAPMAAMNAPAGPSGGGMNMMGMMDKMMGMMDKMMSMGGAAPSSSEPKAGEGMGMGMDKMKKGPGAASGPSQGGMGMDKMDKMRKMGMEKMKMAGMMGMGRMGGGPGAISQSALPGFPGASHLYHLGATGFFLDHETHIALTSEQQAALNKAREQAQLAMSTADRAGEQAEQELWALTASDQPDAAKIEAKIAQIEKLRGDERLAFIRAVGEASKLLTDEQRKILTGFAPPAPAPAAAMPPGGMKGM